MNSKKASKGDFVQRFRTDPEVTKSVFGLVNYLEASEQKLLQVLGRTDIWPDEAPLHPGVEGDLEFGLFPYWIKHPPQDIQDQLEQNEEVKKIFDLLKSLIDNKIDEAGFQIISSASLDEPTVGPDGTIMGSGTYEYYDSDWAWVAYDYALVQAGDLTDFSGTNVSPITLKGAVPDQVKVALVGDWGTGVYENGPAQDVIDQITNMNPDYIIHLGDVYYAGTAGFFFKPSDEEQDNFLALWPTTLPAGNSFILNSNHEMYAGAQGYFLALADPRFAAQQQTSYFALQFGGWTILGLDSAYFSTSHLYMHGNIGGAADSTQNDWIQGLNLTANKTIVLTHHNGLTFDGSAEDQDESGEILCDQINTALGGKDPTAWYWGHVHNGIVYNSPTVTGRNTLSRCVGHGAFPFGNGLGIPGDFVSYYAHTPNPKFPPRVLNGFAMLTISSTGTVTEELFEQDNAAAVFSNTYG